MRSRVKTLLRIFLDIDGTLLDSKGKVSTGTKQAIDSLRKSGIKVFIATGRHLTEIKDIPVNSITFDGYITLNGQLCLDKNRKALMGHPITIGDAKTLINVFNQNQIPCLIVQENKMYINFVDEMVKKVQEKISTSIPLIGTYQKGKIYQFCVYGDDQTINKISTQLLHCKMTKWNLFGADIIDKSGGKLEGIKYFQKLYNFKDTEIMAIGDGENDIDMLKFAGIGVAMGNANEQVKSAADFITSDVDHDGVAKILEKMDLI